MKRRHGFAWLAGALFAGTLAAGAAGKGPIGAGAQWPSVNADSNETGFSRLTQITPANAGRLGLAWSLDLPGESSLEASPVAIDGRLYFTGSHGAVYAVEMASGHLLWRHDPEMWRHNPGKMNFSFAVNRGVAYAGGRIFSAVLDGRLMALDAKTGAKLWEVETTDPASPQTVTGAPRVFDGKVIIGQGGADFGQRGYVTAYDQATGKQLWRFYVTPGSPEQNRGDPVMEAAAKSWSPDFWKHTGGGGGPWDSITYDAEMHRIYIGTSNAAPYDSEARSPGNGDNLYTASIVALDADTGTYLWHYQLNPRDSWDFDSTQQMMLATLTIDGKPRRVLMQAPKNGFFYVIDRDTGRVISAGKLGKVNWADRIDLATGRPVERPNIRYHEGEIRIYPSGSGAHSWMRMAYSPQTGLVYVPYQQLATRFRRGEPGDDDVNVMGLNVGHYRGEKGDGTGALIAWDPVAQRARWRVPYGAMLNGGVAATAGGVVFQGTALGDFNAYDARSGRRLWHVPVGMGIIGAPSVWSWRGREYVSVLAGYGGSAAIYGALTRVGWKYSSPRRLFTFTLDGGRRMPAAPPRSLQVAPLDNPAETLDPGMIAKGRAIFLACASCHGLRAVATGGPAPDLRESGVPLDAESFYTLVHDGPLLERGMPQFTAFDRATIEALRQYIRAQARRALAENAKASGNSRHIVP